MTVSRYLITAGPTHEPIDAVRYLANRSSGAMGIALAEAAVAAGHHVTLLLGPTHLTPHAGAAMTTLRFESTFDLTQLLATKFPECDVLIMAAAVADYTPRQVGSGKIERRAGLTLELQPTVDLVADCAARRRPNQQVIGFALEEPDQLERRARGKLHRKNLNAIVANPLRTMGAADIDATVYAAADQTHSPGPMSKGKFAEWLIDWIDRDLNPGEAL